MQRVGRIRRAVSVGLQALLIVGLSIAYLGAAAGLVGLIDARSVVLMALCGATVAFVAIIAYLVTADAARRRNLRTR